MVCMEVANNSWFYLKLSADFPNALMEARGQEKSKFALSAQSNTKNYSLGRLMGILGA